MVADLSDEQIFEQLAPLGAMTVAIEFDAPIGAPRAAASKPDRTLKRRIAQPPNSRSDGALDCDASVPLVLFPDGCLYRQRLSAP
jgi:hypothetical protein